MRTSWKRGTLFVVFVTAVILLPASVSGAPSRPAPEHGKQIAQNDRDREKTRLPGLRRLLALVGLSDTLIGPRP